MKDVMTRLAAALALVIGAGLAPSAPRVRAQEQAPEYEQSVLGPGLYVFQTRTVSATCGDDERTGYVSTFVAAIHGIPGSREMRMQLVNSPWWASWTLRVEPSGQIIGDARVEGESRTNHFEVSRDRRGRFAGQGTRTYRSGQQRCSVTFDALLRRIDGL